MEKVTGIGGVFFRAKDPDALSRWYSAHLGVLPPPQSYADPPWEQTGGPTIFAPMTDDAALFAPGSQLFINFRVGDLDAMRSQLESAGIPVQLDPEEYPNGRFASLTDPEGNQIQLWEPKEPDLP
ncbi:VOC family protein [Naasia sp. SYSU D00057]|uniref:VOC family protein n=1 Tax=Naasia sp. SYSU D00057 TaxID=2817380 RepID=UPI001B30BD3B|nr:VOC family protein [Naasia sp. SYSU D00057]